MPVSGSSEPIVSTPSPARSAVTGTRSTTDDSGDSAVTSVSSSVSRLSAPNSRIAYEPLQRLAVAVEVERAGDAVVVGVAAGLDDRQAVGVRRALLAVLGDADDLGGVRRAVILGRLHGEGDDDHGVVGSRRRS